MKLSEQAKTKLDLIRIEGLCKLVFNKIDEETNTNIYFIPKMELYNNIISYLNEEVNIDFSGYMYIINNNLQIVEKSKGELLKVNEIKEFKEICDLNIQKEEQTQLQKRLKKIKEKCNESNKEKCM